jgi:hypothetical protein
MREVASAARAPNRPPRCLQCRSSRAVVIAIALAARGRARGFRRVALAIVRGEPSHSRRA